MHNAKKAIFSENIKRENRGEKIHAGVRKEMLCAKIFRQVEKRGASSSLVNFGHKSGNSADLKSFFVGLQFCGQKRSEFYSNVEKSIAHLRKVAARKFWG